MTSGWGLTTLEEYFLLEDRPLTRGVFSCGWDFEDKRIGQPSSWRSLALSLDIH
jgi:hypothetical protein